MTSEIKNEITPVSKKEQPKQFTIETIPRKKEVNVLHISKWVRDSDRRETATARQLPLPVPISRLQTATSFTTNTITISQANQRKPLDQTALGGKKGIAVSEEELKELFATAIPWDGDPYEQIEKDQFHEAVRTDGMVKRALKFMITFLLGKDDPTTELQTNLVYKTPELKAAALEQIQNNEQYQSWKQTIDEIDQESDFYNKLKAALFNCFTFGRAVLVKLYNADGLPVRLIPLSSMRLGRIWVDAATWEFLAVEYLDYPTERRLLLARDIIYFSMDDYNHTPNSLYYGFSWIEPIAWISEANRIMHQKDIPEIVEKFWAPAFLIESLSMDDEQNKSIVDAIEPGRNILVRGAAKIQQVSYNAPIDDIVTLSDLQNMKILRDLSIPLLAGGFENIQNRSVALTVVQQWGESTPKELRNWLKNILEKQWYEPNLRTLVEKDVQSCEGCIFDMLGIVKPDVDTPEDQKTPEQRLEEKASLDLTGKIKYPFKIAVIFAEIIVDTFLDRTAAVVGLHKEGLINEDIALDLANLDQYRETMRLEREKEEKLRVVQLEAELANVKEEQAAQDFGNGNGNARQLAGTDAAKKEKAKGKEEKDNDTKGGMPLGARLSAKLS